MFYAPSIDYYVVTRYADIERSSSTTRPTRAAPAQLPLVQLVPEARKILLDGRAQAAAVDGQPRSAGAHASAFADRAGVHAATRRGRWSRGSAATVDELLDAVDPSRPFDLVRGAHLPAAGHDHLQLHRHPGARLAAAQGVVRPPRQPRLGTADARGAGGPRAEHGRLPRLPARARRAKATPRRRLRQRAAGDPRRGSRGARRTRRSARSSSRSASPGTRRRTT